MEGFKARFRLAAIVVLSIGIALVAIYDLLKPISNGCAMTYMYPTYIPISATESLSSSKYGLYLYHEGWKKIDFNEHLKQLSGVPILFIPGNGGSYKQYTRRLDWFAVDLEGEHSAMDGQILEEHTEYVVYAIHRILDQYKESQNARVKEGAVESGSLPNSVILVGHSMGGFVARAAVVHPNLRKSAIETVLTLSTPHQSPPVALQPSLGHYYEYINKEWRKGYEVQTSRTGAHSSNHQLSQVIVVSISGGGNDYQVRSKLESVDGIVPSTHGFMISSMGMKNVWLSMEHQVILWCNQLVVQVSLLLSNLPSFYIVNGYDLLTDFQVSHTLLRLVDPETGHPISGARKRLAILTKMLHSGMPGSLSRQSHLLQQSPHLPLQKERKFADHLLGPPGSRKKTITACPSKLHWSDEGLERDLYIKTPTVTILAMDGRRRWLDIKELGSNGRNTFVLVTNLLPCYGVRLHLWPEKGTSPSDLPLSKRVIEVTSKIAQISSGPAPRQIEPGSQTEQPPPSAVFWLDAKDMHGFRFLTISVAPSPTVSGRPPPAASMAVGQFFNPEEGRKEFSPLSLLLSMYSQKDIFIKEDHPIAMNITFSISLGLLPATVSLETTGCGIKKSGLPVEEAGDMDSGRLCKLRCFPPVALAWDATSGVHIFPNLYSHTIEVDSSPALWSSAEGSEQTNVLLLVDPHCSYKTSAAVSLTASGRRFMLLYASQIIGFAFAVVFFALMRQANAWELDLPVPSLLSAVESNLRMPLPFLLLAISPLLIALFYSCLSPKPLPSVIGFFVVSIICYLLANGIIIILTLTTQIISHVVARVHVMRVINANPSLAMSLLAIALVCFVHPALGLLILLFSHVLCCHNALCRSSKSNNDENEEGLPVDENSSGTPDSARSYGETQLEIFHHRHGLLILHLLSLLMFLPSLVAWLERLSMGHNFPWLLDSALCMGVVLHGICGSKPEFNVFFQIPGMRGYEIRQGLVYLLAGYCCYLSGLDLAPYKAFYAMAAIGIVSFVFRIIERRNQPYYSNRKHSHRH
ncbi:GPI inositol-deacylase PGAP1-like protein [Cynara cardunculus var. scolymus]|uniref:GPI inositol-deacylase n=1 Tax=Cynara cardunculus var. scolymus TaxID=59895 RepID=A0A124SBH1_CYNCS|nr:GPI inositol-deacylase PGAP1-like protein [Cynara cardunculus var. scolymus]